MCPKCGQRKIIENENEQKKKKRGVSRCTVLKSDPPALRTGNDKFRISFSHVQRSLSNRKPAEKKEREEKKKKKKKETTRTVFSWAHSLQDVQIQVSYGCKSAAWAVLLQT